MIRIDVPEGVDPLLHADALAPVIRGANRAMRKVTLDDTSLRISEVEVIRLRCAQLNGCLVCSDYRLDRDDPDRAARAADRFSPEFYAAILGEGPLEALTIRERLVRELAERFTLDHFSLVDDEPFWDRMHTHFSDTEIVDAGMVVASFCMSGRFNRVLGLDERDSCPIV